MPQHAKPRNWRVAEGEAATETDGVLEAWILVRDRDRARLWLISDQGRGIWTLLTTMVELKGHEEKAGFTRALGARHGVNPAARPGRSCATRGREARHARAALCADHRRRPGRIGLGARLRQLGVPTIIVEKNERAGDSWRKRYKSLCLHDPVWYDHLPYIDFPKNWPVFSPKDKIGDWLEMYAKVMELNYWTTTTVKSASFDEARRNGRSSSSETARSSRLRPKQLVFATGMSAKPIMPKLQGHGDFTGDQHHSSKHPGPDAYKGKRVVVIGSNNSAHDICAALYESGVDVTMVQRSCTHIVRSRDVDGYRPRRSLFRARGTRA